MKGLPHELPLLPRGPLPHQHYQEVTRRANALRNAEGDGQYIALELQNGTLKARWIGTRPDTRARRMKITAIANDYLTCVEWDGTTQGTESILVAKDFKNRHVLANYPQLTSLSTVDTQTIRASGTVSGSTVTETAKISPAFNVGDEIYAEANPAGGTGVTVSGAELTWIDTNRDGRQWAVPTT